MVVCLCQEKGQRVHFTNVVDDEDENDDSHDDDKRGLRVHFTKEVGQVVVLHRLLLADFSCNSHLWQAPCTSSFYWHRT